MLSVHRILYPTDFSDCSRQAFGPAVYLAEKYGAELHMLHVWALHEADPGDPSLVLPGMDKVYEELMHMADERMRKDGEAHRSHVHIQHSQVRAISAGVGILDYALEHDIDLISMGTHGRRGLRRLLVGSVAEEVVHLAKCPVLVARAEGNGAGDGAGVGAFRTIVVPVDFSTHSKLALAYANELAAETGSSIHVLHVVEDVAYPDFYYPVSARRTLAAGVLRQEAQKQLGWLAAEAKLPGVDVTTHVLIGRAVHEIADFARSHGADLIVMASHGLTGLEGMLLGSVAASVLRHAPCSVLTVKAFGKNLLTKDEAVAHASSDTP